jgi:hypothetical protein
MRGKGEALISDLSRTTQKFGRSSPQCDGGRGAAGGGEPLSQHHKRRT